METSSSMKNELRAVLFDLDGTILDTNELIIQSFLHAVKGIAPPDFGREHIIPSMGLPLAEQLQLFTGLTEVDEVMRAYREYNARIHDELVSLFPGVAEVIPRLKERGIKLGIVTTKMRPMTEKALHMFGLYPYMDAIITLDDVARPKPHPEPVLKAASLIGAEPAHTLMVGDSVVDVESAKRAGAWAAGVTWSLKGEAVLRDAGADLILESMEQLLTLFETRGAEH